MLKSLFGDASARTPVEFAATAVLDPRGETSESGRAVDRHTQDIRVETSAGDALRRHLSESALAGELRGAQVLTLFDPARMWASAVVKALSDASGQAIERLHLRDAATLSTLATVEQTTFERREGGRLRIHHAEVRDGVPAAQEVPLALMESSDVGAVIIGPLHAGLVDSLLSSLHEATRTEAFHCPRLLFLLPVGAEWIERRIRDIDWPPMLDVQIISEPLTSASAVWNVLLAHGAEETSPATIPDALHDDIGLGTAHVVTAQEPVPTAVATDVSRRDPDEISVLRSMREVMMPSGVVGAALVNVGSGALMATEGGGTLDMELAAASATDLMRAHQRAMRYYVPTAPLAHPTAIDEVTVAASGRIMVMRTVAAHPHMFMLVILDRARARPEEVRTHLDAALAQLI